MTITELSAEAKTFNWLLDNFTANTVGVLEAVAVSSDGLPIAMSAIKDRANADRLAAVVSGMTSLAGGAAHCYSLGDLNRVIVDLTRGLPAGDGDQRRVGDGRHRRAAQRTWATSPTR